MYEYQAHRQHVFTEAGSRDFLKIRDKANALCASAGCVRVDKLMREVSGSSWDTMALIERLVELQEFYWLNEATAPAWQARVLVKNGGE
jgi:hypothetical protein